MIIQFVLIQLVMLAVIVFVLRKFLLSDAMSTVRRLQRINSENEKKEEELQKKALETEEECKKKLLQADQEARALKEQAKKETDSLKSQILEKASLESDAIIGAAKENASGLRQKISQELGAQAIDYALKLVSLSFNKKMQEVLHEELMREFLFELEKLEKSHINPNVKEAVLISAQPVTGEQKEGIKKIFTHKLGKDIQIKEETDKRLVAGIVVRLDTLVMDASLANRLEETTGELKKELGE